jgi:hypothetical protein
MASIGLLSELFIVFAAAIPFSTGQLLLTFTISFWLCFSILIVILLAVFAAAIWRRKMKVPRIPHTLGGVMSYLCASRMLADFETVSERTEKPRNRLVMGWNHEYRFGITTDKDGIKRWAVDYANTEDSTKWNVDYSRDSSFEYSSTYGNKPESEIRSVPRIVVEPFTATEPSDRDLDREGLLREPEELETTIRGARM